MDFLGRLLVQIVGDNSQLDQSIDDSRSRLQRFSQSAVRIGQTLTTRLTLPITLAAGAAVRLAIQAEETNSAFRTSFRGIEEAADSAATNLQENFGLSRLESERLLQSTGDLLRGFGATQEEALEVSERVQQLAVDLASFRNVQGGAERASEALTAALLGERDQLRSLGIVIREADVQQRLLENGQADLAGQARLTAVAQATLELAYEQSGDAVGDFARTSDSTANQLRQLRSDITDAAVEIGENLLPAVNDILTVLRDLSERFAGLSEEQQRLILIFAGVAAAAGPAILAIGRLSQALVFLAANPAVLGVAVVLAGIAAAIIAVNRAAAEGRESVQELASELGTTAEELDEVARALQRSARVNRSFEAISREVDRIAESTGRTRREVLEIGVASSRVSDRYREQLQLVLDQEPAQRTLLEEQEDLNEAARQTVQQTEARERSLIVQGEALERQVEITERLNALLEEERTERIDLLAIDELIRAGALTEEEGLERKIALREEEIARLREQLIVNETLLIQGERSADLAGTIRDRVQSSLDDQLDAQQRYYDRLADLQDDADSNEEENATNSFDRTRGLTAQQVELYAGLYSTVEARDRQLRRAEQEGQEQSLRQLSRNIREQVALYQQLTSAVGGVFGALTQFENAQIANFQRAQQLESEGLQQQTEEQVAALEARIEAENEAAALIAENEQAIADERIERLNAQLEQDRARIQSSITDRIIADAQIAALEMATAEQIETIRDNLASADQTRTDEREIREQEIAATIEELETGLAEETDRIREETERRQRRLQRRQAARQKAISLFDIAVNTASAIAEALPNIPLSIFVGAAGAAQAALVAATPLPSLAQGGFFSGPALIGEAGREFAFPIDGAQGQAAMSLMADRIVDSMSRSQGGSTTNNNSNVTINSMFNLGTEQQQRRAARALFPALENEAARRGQQLTV